MSETERRRETKARSESRLHLLRDWGTPLRTEAGRAYIAGLEAVRRIDAWRRVWTGQRHDHRFHEIVRETVPFDGDFHYLILEDTRGEVRAIQPFFVCSQGMLDGINGPLKPVVTRLGRFPLRMLMVGSTVGEGGLGAAPSDRRWAALALTRALPLAARRLRARIIALKEFPSELRPVLDVFRENGYARIASLPYVTLDLDFRSFDGRLAGRSKAARRDYRRKVENARRFPPLTMAVTHDISAHVDELYPLYLQVYERARSRFEKLTPDYFRRLGRDMPDRSRFFVWTQSGKPVGFYSALLHDGALWIDVLGMDYAVALDLHLYFLMKRDVIDWGCANGVRRYCGGPLNYEPKLRLECRLQPMDLYLRHVNPLLNRALLRLAPLLSPARYEPILRKFPNAGEL